MGKDSWSTCVYSNGERHFYNKTKYYHWLEKKKHISIASKRNYIESYNKILLFIVASAPVCDGQTCLS